MLMAPVNESRFHGIARPQPVVGRVKQSSGWALERSLFPAPVEREVN